MIALLQAWVMRARRALLPSPPPAVKAAFLRMQIDSIDRASPVMWLIGTFYTVAVVAITDYPTRTAEAYLLPVVAIIVCVTRYSAWRRRRAENVSDAVVETVLNASSRLIVLLVAISAVWSMIEYHNPAIRNPEFIAVFTTLGVVATGYCYINQPVAALAILAVGIVPNAVSLVVTGTPLDMLLGIAIAVAATMASRQVVEQYRHTLDLLVVERQMQNLANSDALTGMPNRRAFLAALQDEVGGTGFGVAILDLDGFKGVNDRLGHLAGDQLLCVVARRLRCHTARGDYAARLGGDEFAVLFRGITGEADIARRTALMLHVLNRPTTIDNERVPIEASMGYARAPYDGHDATTLMTAADRALYAAKFHRRAQIGRTRHLRAVPAAPGSFARG